MLKRSLILVLALVLVLGIAPFHGSANTIEETLVLPDILNATYQESESNNTRATADYAYAGDTMVGKLTYADVDYYKFTLYSASKVTILSIANYKSTIFGVWNSAGNCIVASTFLGYQDGYAVQVIDTSFSAGTYYIGFLNSNKSTDTYAFMYEYEASSHTHSYTAGNPVPPTCEDDGYTKYTCSCGDYYYDDYVDATGHDYEANVVPPTCHSEGYTTYTCANCGDSYDSDYVGIVDHEFGSYISDNNGSEYSEGTKTRTCKHCGETETVADTGVYMADVVMGEPTAQLGGNIIRWEAVEGAKLYQVFRLDGGSWVLLKNTGSLAYKDETAPINQKAYYKVRARNGDLMSSMAIPAVSVTRPKLENVTITKTTPHTTGNIINWEAVPYANLYQVYRLEGGSWVLLKNTGSLAYKDETAPEGVRTYYKIVARYGEYKSDIGTTQSKSCMRPGSVLPNVTITGVNGHKSGNIITWKAVESATLYQVYRLEGNQWVLLKNTGSLAYKDETAPVGQRTYYKIVARNGNASSNIGTTASASGVRAAS